jgi:hypothetical protein
MAQETSSSSKSLARRSDTRAGNRSLPENHEQNETVATARRRKRRSSPCGRAALSAAEEKSAAEFCSQRSTKIHPGRDRYRQQDPKPTSGKSESAEREPCGARGREPGSEAGLGSRTRAERRVPKNVTRIRNASALLRTEKNQETKTRRTEVKTGGDRT